MTWCGLPAAIRVSVAEPGDLCGLVTGEHRAESLPCLPLLLGNHFLAVCW